MSGRRREVLDGLAEIINEIAGVPVEDVRMSALFTDDLDLDSLSLVEVIVAAEERFRLQIPDADVVDVLSVRDAVNYLVKHMAATGG
ncbi:acyl carrier protein [Streptomyces crystallinus]|uniref:acyl carrier protein n=1 Tax=Streptomyces crystallinus TaxID=68191 RepID=UPI0031D28AF8